MREPDDEQQEQARQRVLRGVLGLLQIGGLGFLAVMIVGLLPRLLAGWFPALGKPWVTVAAGAVATLLVLAFSALRLRRLWREDERRGAGDDDARRR